MMLSPSLKDDINQLGEKYKNIRWIRLFGSRARGDAKERSDIDLAISLIKDDTKTWVSVLEDIEDLNTLLKIDVIKWEEASEELQQEIDYKYVVLYEMVEQKS